MTLEIYEVLGIKIKVMVQKIGTVIDSVSEMCNGRKFEILLE